VAGSALTIGGLVLAAATATVNVAIPDDRDQEPGT
jgi:hypothetical protein